MKQPEAGRELDVLVAEKVMGWGDVKMGATGIAGGIEPGSSYRSHVPLPRYSTDISAAWEVAERLLYGCGYVEVVISPCGTPDGRQMVRCVFRPWDYLAKNYGAKEGEAIGDTTPHAICLAALKAVEDA